MRKISLLLLFVFVAGCVSLTSAQKKEITTQIVDSSYETTYRGTLKFLREEGYTVRNADMKSGLIRANIKREISKGRKAGAIFLLLLGAVAEIHDNKVNKHKHKSRNDEDDDFVFTSGKIVWLNFMIRQLSYKQSEIVLLVEKRMKYTDGTSSLSEVYDQHVYDHVFAMVRLYAGKYYKDLQQKVKDVLLKNKPQSAKEG